MLSSTQAKSEWERCRPWLEAALHRGGDPTTIDEVWEAVQAGRCHFWPAIDSAVVTQLCSKGRELNIYLAGGRIERLREMLPSLEAFGKALGCQIVTILGRRGWERTFLTREMGYAPVATLLGKELPNDVERP